MAFHAGFVVAEYAEGAAHCRALFYSVLVDARRVPVQRPHDDHVRAGGRLEAAPGNHGQLGAVQTERVSGEMRGQGRWADTARRMLVDINRIGRKNAARRDRKHEKIETDQRLTLMGENDYRNPLTEDVERDTRAWKDRSMDSPGECIDRNDALCDPNGDPGE